MKRFFKISFLVCVQLVFAQNQRFFYEYKFASDSTRKDSTITELMRLDILPKGSKYYSHNGYIADSIMDVKFKKQKGSNDIITMDGTPKYVVKHKVYKTYPDFKVNMMTEILPDTYDQSDDRPMKWKILNDKQKIGEWDCQKATTYFAGRQWTAWFTTSIPLQDGPYKFRGLPGLIVKVNNQNETLVFELKGAQKNDKIKFNDDFELSAKATPVSYQQYFKIYKNYLKDPVAGIRKMYKEGTFYMTDNTGNVIPQQQVIKSYEDRTKEAMKKNNNPIELDLLK